MARRIRGTKLIKHTGRVDNPDDPSYRYKLVVKLNWPIFAPLVMRVRYDAEELIVRGRTVRALQRYIETNELEMNPNLRSLVITGPGDQEVQAVRV